MFKVFEIGYVFSLANRMSGALSTIARDLQNTRREVQGTEAAVTKLRASMLWAGGALLATGGIVAGLRSLYKAGQQVTEAMAQFQSIGLDATSNARAFTAAWRTAMQIPGTTWSENIQLLRDAHVALGDLNEALQVNAKLAKAQFGLGVVSPEVQESLGGKKMFDLVKALELRGAFRTPGRFTAELDQAVKAITASGGRVDPTALFEFMKRGNIAARALSPKAFYGPMADVIQELGGAGAGTALMSTYQMLLGGQMTARTAQELLSLRLLDPHKVIWNKLHKVSRVRPGAIAQGDLLQQDPFAWVNRVFVPALERRRGRALSEAETHEAILGVFGGARRTVPQLIDIFATQRGRIEKFMGIQARSKSVDELYELATRVRAGDVLGAARTNLMQEIGKQWRDMVAPYFLDLAKAMNRVADLLMQHPERMQGGLKGAAGAAGYLGLLGAGGMASGILRFMGFNWLAGLIGGIVQAISPIGLLRTAFEWIRLLIPVATFALRGLGLVFVGLTSPISLVVGAVTLLILALTHWNDAVRIAKTGVQVLMEIVHAFIDVVRHPFGGGKSGLTLEQLSQMGMGAYQTGTAFVPRTGLALLHRGESVLSAARTHGFQTAPPTRAERATTGSVQINLGGIHITQQPGEDARALADRLWRMFDEKLRDAARATGSGILHPYVAPSGLG